MSTELCCLTSFQDPYLDRVLGWALQTFLVFKKKRFRNKDFRAFALARAKNSLYILTFQNTPYQIIYFTLYFIKISIFSGFFKLFLFLHSSHITTIIHFLSSSSRNVKKEYTTKCKMNSASVNLDDYFSKFVNLQCYYSKFVNLYRLMWIIFRQSYVNFTLFFYYTFCER